MESFIWFYSNGTEAESSKIVKPTHDFYLALESTLVWPMDMGVLLWKFLSKHDLKGTTSLSSIPKSASTLNFSLHFDPECSPRAVVRYHVKHQSSKTAS